MAQRLATEYVNATFKLSEPQMHQFLRMSDDGRIHHRVKVLDNGCQEIVLADVSGEEVHFPFDRQKGFYICELSCRLVNHHLTNVVRKLFMTFKGDGVVHRIYEEFTMTYVYAQGSVRKIVEQNGENTRLIYEYKNTLLELQRQFQARDVEREINRLYAEVDTLLDTRIHTSAPEELHQIDATLARHQKRLFELEA
ncbi:MULTISPECIES: non-ribosomal peptide synthetase module [Paenibacillus]|uniref:non-ribosomal peptide synthetase module n=1 Tax=Paenibacillus TaxID=44249 RepID=UPI00129EEFB8|nr:MULTISPECIES: non-ribosomal peptide synthetase module [Paenibacillus]MBE7682975.1 non-ribosomal peptide synthetase module [Paenibacillus sp. P13VS]MBY0220272.1 non-ribosomal peptide synthetase module [Paenibacillus illinoisensis]MCM3207143.1 non-ribosomal peptide synthetase module [Paenibacillus illinoisensis]